GVSPPTQGFLTTVVLKVIERVKISKKEYGRIAEKIMKEQLIFPRKGFINPHHEGIVPLAIRLSVDEIDDAGRIRRRETRQDLLRKRINVDNHIPGDRLPGQQRRAPQVAAGWARHLVLAGGNERL